MNSEEKEWHFYPLKLVFDHLSWCDKEPKKKKIGGTIKVAQRWFCHQWQKLHLKTTKPTLLVKDSCFQHFFVHSTDLRISPHVMKFKLDKSSWGKNDMAQSSLVNQSVRLYALNCSSFVFFLLLTFFLFSSVFDMTMHLKKPLPCPPVEYQYHSHCQGEPCSRNTSDPDLEPIRFRYTGNPYYRYNTRYRWAPLYSTRQIQSNK